MQALGLIETRGLVGAIEASDAALKAANSDSTDRIHRPRTGHSKTAR